MFCHGNASPPTTAATLLLGNGADAGDTDADGNTVLPWAVRNLRNVERVCILLDRAASPAGVFCAVDAQGNAPLHVAAGQGDLFGAQQGLTVEDRIRPQDEMVRTLIPPLEKGEGIKGVDGAGPLLLNHQNIAGKTPKQLREEKRNKWRQNGEAQRHPSWAAGVGRGPGAIIPRPSESNFPW